MLDGRMKLENITKQLKISRGESCTSFVSMAIVRSSRTDVPQSTDHYMEPAQHGVQDVLNISTEWIRSGDCPFTKAKRSNRDVSDQNELQTYASLEKMLHKAIHVVGQLKKKGNTNTSSATKQQSNSSSPSNSDLKTNKSLVTLEKIETEPEKEDPLPIFDDYAHEPKEESGGEQTCSHKEGSSSIHKPETQDLRTNLFEVEGNDMPQSTDHYMEPAQHGVQDVLNISTEVHVFHRTRLDLDHARLEKDHARLEKDHPRTDLTWIMPDLTWVVKKPKTDMHSHPTDHPDSPASVLIVTPCIHLVRMNLDII
uniref:Uncharacterized protein n=1 Tax=Brassica oleracea var. oleracea TaxID=109376 RepID=A0A0D3EEY9_BRAOL